MSDVDEVMRMVGALEAQRDEARASLSRVAKALGLDGDAGADDMVRVISTLAVDERVVDATRRMTKIELAAAEKAGAKVSFADVPADASCVVDGEAVLLVEVR